MNQMYYEHSKGNEDTTSSSFRQGLQTALNIVKASGNQRSAIEMLERMLEKDSDGYSQSYGGQYGDH